MAGQQPRSERDKTVRQAMMAMAVPGLLVGGTLGCGAVGFFLGKWLGAPAWGALTGLLIGFAIAILEIFKIVKKINSES